MTQESFVDIHCHLIPGIDDGAADAAETLAMARLAVADGIGTIICTPHQGGNFARNRGDDIRAAVVDLQRFLHDRGSPLRVLPGADIRLEAEMVAGLQRGELVTLGDHGRHVLLELPHELYIPLEPVLAQLARVRLIGILSHPERNQGILGQPTVMKPLVEAGCLVQLTAGSLVGDFGSEIRGFSEWLLAAGLVHFIATDAHGSGSRRPQIRRAFDRVCELTGPEVAVRLCCRNPARVAEGRDVAAGVLRRRRPALSSWLSRRMAG